MSSFYFAHPTTMYDTGAERQLMARFQRSHPAIAVENPNKPEHSEGYAKGGMDYFVGLCDSLDGVFYAPFADGTMGAGVAKEVRSFLERGAPVLAYDPQKGDFVELSPQARDSCRDGDRIGSAKVRDVDATRARLKQERAMKEAGQDPYRDADTFQKSLVDVTA